MSVVFVTSTDFVTVYPTVQETASLPSSTLMSDALTSLLPSFELLIPTAILEPTVPFETPEIATMNPSTMIPSITRLPPLPSGWPAPIVSTLSPETEIPETKPKPWSDHMAGLSLAAVILMVLLLLALFGYAIYQRFRGKCHNCPRYEKELENWRNGDLKVITKEMVKSRESLNSQVPSTRSKLAPHGAYEDLERGEHRAEALAALTRPDPAKLKPSLWERARGIVKPKVKPVEDPSPSPPITVGDRFFTVIGVETPDPPPQTEGADYMLPRTTYSPPPQHTYPAQTYPANAVPNRLYSPPSPSEYSRTTHFPIKSPKRYSPKRPGSQQSEHYIPGPPRSPSPSNSHHPKDPYSEYTRDEWRPARLRAAAVEGDDGSVVSSALILRDPKHRMRYEKAQQDMARGSIVEEDLKKAIRDVNVVEKQMRARQRIGGYGGLGEVRDV